MRVGLERVLSRKSIKQGNYKTEVTNDGDTSEIYLWTTVICGYDQSKKIYFADNRGFGSATTTRAVNDCIRWCEDKGYKQVTVDEFKAQTGAKCEVGTWAY